MIAKTNTLLIELGTEELPPTQLTVLENSLKANFAMELQTNNLKFTAIESFATPRRLALKVLELAEKQADVEQERQGPQISQAFNADGSPTKAGLGFAKSCGVEITQLLRKETTNGEVLAFTTLAIGKTSKELIPGLFKQALAKLPVQKAMRWGSLNESFVRPVHWLLMLQGKEIIPATLFGIESNRNTYGHRFHKPGAISLKQADDYENALLSNGMVIPISKQRQELISSEIDRVAKECGGQAQIMPELLDLVTGLVEYPVVLSASFDKAFLSLPKEALISAMQEHQKCFPLLDSNGQLLAKFILVSNIKSSDSSTVVRGNEKVMHARLADAQFHYQQDKKATLAAHLDKLKAVIFQQRLGSVYAKTVRIRALAVIVAKKIGAKHEDVAKAATICKADLLTQMVGEFPELQGVMGYYYARNDGESKEVALAIREHYLPKHAQDSLPYSAPGICLALADRIDTLVGMFAIGKAPTADKDPFGLRRQALGMLRILIEKALRLDLREMFAASFASYGDQVSGATNTEVADQLMSFCFERLRGFCADKAIPAKTFAAVLAKAPACPFDFYCRLKAVQGFQGTPVAANLSEANKRVQNILVKSGEEYAADDVVNPELLVEAAEQQLYQLLCAKEQEIKPLLAQADYAHTLTTLTTLNAAIDDFFVKVMVMSDDLNLKRNRLLLLHKLRGLFLQVADISLL